MLCNKYYKKTNKKRRKKEPDLKRTEMNFQCLFIRYSLVLRHFACQNLVDI